jgi:uncharacterized protein (TIGR02453 family)
VSRRPVAGPVASRKETATRARRGAPAGGQPVFDGFPRDTVAFLRALARHNTEAWMEDSRARYEAAILTPARQAVVAVGDALHQAGVRVVADPRVNGSIFRIARDRRFRPDVPPYKTHLALLWWADGVRMEEPAFYVQINTKGLEYGVGLPEIPRAVLPQFRRWLVEGDNAARLLAAMELPESSGISWELHQVTRLPHEFRGVDAGRAQAVRLLGGWGGSTHVPHPVELFTAEFPAWLVARWEPLMPYWRVLREGLSRARR